MARPRDPNVQSSRLYCAVHGELTEHRQWKQGRTASGVQRYRWACTLCHAARNLAIHHRNRKGTA